MVRDRGQYWASIASSAEPDGWMFFSDVCEVLFGPGPPEPLTLEATMAQVRDRFAVVAPRVAADGAALQARVAALARERARGSLPS